MLTTLCGIVTLPVVCRVLCGLQEAEDAPLSVGNIQRQWRHSIGRTYGKIYETSICHI